jgi:ATP-dependent exoDNAse (exonuclease V) beta subunit
MKKLPVRFGKALEQTVFKKHYSEEVRNYVADAFNMIYVAFTRPMERLYIFSPVAKLPVEEFISSKDILASVISELSEPEELSEFISGEKSNAESKSKKKVTDSVYMNEYISTEWREKISIAEKNYEQSGVVKERMKKVRYGSIAHKLLSTLKTNEYLDAELHKMFYAGWIDGEEMTNLKKQIQSLFENTTVRKFFTEQWIVLTEREILLPDGKIMRPDRVLLKDDNAIVIDFKTGKQKPEDALQVQTYAEQLTRMNYSKIEKYLVYLENASVVQV